MLKYTEKELKQCRKKQLIELVIFLSRGMDNKDERIEELEARLKSKDTKLACIISEQERTKSKEEDFKIERRDLHSKIRALELSKFELSRIILLSIKGKQND